MATHSSIFAWRIPWTEEPGGLQSMGSQSWTRLKRLSTHRHIATVDKWCICFSSVLASLECWCDEIVS